MAQDVTTIPQVRSYLLQPNIYDRLRQMADDYEIDQGRVDEFLDLTDAVLKGRIATEDMPEMIEQAFALSKDQAKKLATDLAGYRLLPLEEFLPGVEEQIKKWGGDMNHYSSFRLQREAHDAQYVVGQILAARGVELPEFLKKRVNLLAKAYITGERSGTATQKLLTRGSNLGGLEMSQEAAEAFVQDLESHRSELEAQLAQQGLTITGEKEKTPDKAVPPAPVEKKKPVKTKERSVMAEKLRARLQRVVALPKPKTKPAPAPPTIPNDLKEKPKESLPAKAVSHALTKEVPVTSGSVMHQREEKEVKKHARKMKKKAGKGSKLALAGVDAEVQKRLTPALDAMQEKNVDQKTAHAIAEAHIYGRRDPLRTEQLLKEKHGWNAQDVDRVMPPLEDARRMHQGYTSAPAKKTSPTAPEQDIFQKEQEVLNKRHAEKTGKISDQSVEPVAPTARVSAARTKEEELNAQEEKIDPVKIQKAQEASRPKKAKAKLSKPSAAPGKDAGQRITDVRYKQKLVGPVQELGELAPADFRRLSTDATEAVRKIMDKLDLLESSSYEDRIKGVTAWRKSPINTLYVSMAREALMQNLSIQEVSARRRNAGEESLSPAEVSAIVKLNQHIKF